MISNTKEIIGSNIKSIRKKLGRSLKDFSDLCKISKTVLVNIENSKGYGIDVLVKIEQVIQYNLHQLTSKDFKPDEDLLKNLLKFHHGDNEITTILEKLPDIVFAVDEKLIGTEYFDTPREIKQLIAYFEGFGWKYKRSSLTNTLTRMSKKVKADPHPNKKGIHLYSNKVLRKNT